MERNIGLLVWGGNMERNIELLDHTVRVRVGCQRAIAKYGRPWAPEADADKVRHATALNAQANATAARIRAK